MPKIWNLLSPQPDRSDKLGRQVSCHPLVAQLLIQRGIESPEEIQSFLHPNLMGLEDPAQMADIDRAALRLIEATRQGEQITVYTDYDVDGISGGAILIRLLQHLDAKVDSYTPHREREGYGIHLEALETLATRGTRIVISVDCGIRAIEPARRATELGLDLIVTDHHLPGGELPEPFALLNPQRPDCAYPNKDLCGAGVAFKLAWEIARRITGAPKLPAPWQALMLEFLGLAGMATIADVVPLVGENRLLCSFGLKALARSQNPGLQALLTFVKNKNGPLTTRDIGFGLGPRINAAGRLGDAGLALELLTTGDRNRATEIAQFLDNQNQKRRRIEKKIQEEALAMLEALPEQDHKIIVLGSQDWAAGVIGIVSSRLVERFHCPVILIALDGETGRGSGRSISGFHLTNALESASHCLEQFGGHAAAAGMVIREDAIPELRRLLLERLETSTEESERLPTLDIDSEVSLSILTYDLARQFEQMAPFGRGNPIPLLASHRLEVCGKTRRMGSAGNHLQFHVRQDGVSLRAVYFGQGDLVEAIPEASGRLSLAYEIQINRFRNQENVELLVRDHRFEPLES
ncbi:MAG: single-stranded-DNA-specific exonuclease RecJ [Planctomycetota bacterium]|jgi:single-stranded-DNA-specific exonuclease|nr:single-stranded-DNA-specific exonuclease RecJ [Planctomycetota bacterium]